MLEQVGMYGRGIEGAARVTGDALDVMEQRKAAAESADAYSAVADQRATMMQRIEDERNAGTLDDNGLAKIKEDYQDWVGKQYDQYSTPNGRNAFVRASSRAGGMVLTAASHASAIVAGNKAKDNLNTVMNQNSNLVMKDPSQFDSVRDSQTEMIQDQVDAGVLSPADARVAKEKMDGELFKGAFYGHMQSDFNNIKNAVIANGGKVDPNQPGFNHAQAWLAAGKGDGVINADQHEALQREIKGNQAAAITAGKQAIDQKTELLNVQGEKLKVDFNTQLQSNKLDPNAVTKAAQSGLLSSDEQLKYYHLIEQAGKQQLATNPATKNDLMARVLLPDNDPHKISDSSQVAFMVKDGMISMKDYQDIDKAIRSIPANKAQMHMQAELYKVAREKIGTDAPDSEYRNMLFQNFVEHEKQNAIQKQEPVSALFDPASKNFLGNRMQQFIPTPRDQLAKQADAARGVKPKPTTIDAQPGVIPRAQGTVPGIGSEIASAASGAWEGVKSFFSGGNPSPHKTEDIATMDLVGLKKLDPKQMSPAQKAVARARYNELSKKGGK